MEGERESAKHEAVGLRGVYIVRQHRRQDGGSASSALILDSGTANV